MKTLLLITLLASLMPGIKGLMIRKPMRMTAGSGEEVQNSFFDKTPEGLRIFHPAFPLEVLNPISPADAESLAHVKKYIDAEETGSNNKDYQRLPWLVFPMLGVPDSQNFLSSKEIADLFKKNRSSGEFIWARKLQYPQSGCLLLNHWKQQVIYLSEYDIELGAKGYELNQMTRHGEEHQREKTIAWPPMALEMELTEGNWQLVEVSDNIVHGSVLSMLPVQLPKALWELVFLLLLAPSDAQDADALQAMLDTGLSPQKGLIAYLRLLKKVMQRAETYNDIPEYRQIFEKEIIL